MTEKTHHCPICHKVFTHRCAKKGHANPCPVHTSSYVRPGNECVSCHEAEVREANKASKSKK
ncbi:hypothetical protein ACRE_038020 [Hapsidospora chrysogenum ATCC 11550]|uniref:Uncharacterized protein n=1 Tax=Hapsidospora chrysogenum (strain ATCC 11550 / CBS 779.69 / DSM 880 / IAM 14645 / JCM 23072 / IMI 49137) TaxID=857340 RepID=A0A086T7N1_HAPC1|nr:hypothetical protein ACRE_038020 [Hapsidospora chrysogenum ATCC 11550]